MASVGSKELRWCGHYAYAMCHCDSDTVALPTDLVSATEHAAVKAELAKAEARIKEYQTNEPIEFAEKLRTMAQACNVANRRTMYLADKCGELELDLGAAHKRIGALERSLEKLKGVR